MALRLITAPTVEPLTLEEVKEHLRETGSDEDTKIERCIAAARRHLEGPYGFLGRALVMQTWELVLDTFPTKEIVIPLPPLQEIVSVKYDDSGGTEQTLVTSGYNVDAASEPGRLWPITSGWPVNTTDTPNAVRIQFIAGYPDDGNSPADLRANIPDDIKEAMLLHIGSMFEHREQVIIGQTAVALPWGAEQLLRPYRMQLGMA